MSKLGSLNKLKKQKIVKNSSALIMMFSVFMIIIIMVPFYYPSLEVFVNIPFLLGLTIVFCGLFGCVAGTVWLFKFKTIWKDLFSNLLKYQISINAFMPSKYIQTNEYDFYSGKGVRIVGVLVVIIGLLLMYVGVKDDI